MATMQAAEIFGNQSVGCIGIMEAERFYEPGVTYLPQHEKWDVFDLHYADR